MTNKNRYNNLKLSGFETSLLRSITYKKPEDVKLFLEKGANPHYEGDDTKDAFDIIEDLQYSKYSEVRKIGNQMSEILLEHELARTNCYFVDSDSVKILASQEVVDSIQQRSPTSLINNSLNQSYVEKYKNQTSDKHKDKT